MGGRGGGRVREEAISPARGGDQPLPAFSPVQQQGKGLAERQLLEATDDDLTFHVSQD